MLTVAENVLPRATPESQGIASPAVLQFVDAVERQIRDLHSFMLLRHGHVIAEGWWLPYRRQDPHVLFSLSKSFTSTAVGLAVAEGRLSIDDFVLSFFPDEAPAKPSEPLAAMRVRHLLSMSTGHTEDTTAHMVLRPDGDWVTGFFSVPVLHTPGTHFLYNSGATFMLSAIVQKLTGTKLVDYLKPRLFEPLGIQNPVWEESPRGINVGGWGLNITTEDIARFGQLYLQKGLWNGRQIVPEAWIAEATAFQVSNADNEAIEWRQGYGYQFWRCRHGAYRGDGAFGQYCVVMPDQDAVLAITSGVGDMQQPLDLVWEYLLPAMRADSLPDDSTIQIALAKKVATLAIPPVRGDQSSPVSARVSGKTYYVDSNDLTIETIAVDFSGNGCTLCVNTATGEHVFTAGSGVWQEGQTALFNPPGSLKPQPVAGSGAWTAENTYTMVVRLIETPFAHTLAVRFEGDRLTLESTVNVSFEPIRTLVFTGCLA